MKGKWRGVCAKWLEKQTRGPRAVNRGQGGGKGRAKTVGVGFGDLLIFYRKYCRAREPSAVCAIGRRKRKERAHIRNPPRDERFACPRRRVELQAARALRLISTEPPRKEGGARDVQGVLHVLVDLHDCGLVTATVAVVGRREDGDYVPVMRPVAARRATRVSARHTTRLN